jgi:flavin-dependent dehydrogenase
MQYHAPACMPTPEYDALVVGARVAGSTVAARLAQRGRRVLLVDRESFPSDTISTHALAFNAVESLRRLGVLERVEAAGFQRLTRHRAWIDDICIDVPAGPPGTYSLAPRRIVLDQVLIDRAVECGAELIQRARVDALLSENGSVTGATIQLVGGDRRDVRARVVIGADGKQSQVARWVEAEKYDVRAPGRPIYYGYFHGVVPLPDPSIEFFFVSDRIGFCFPMRPNEHLLCLEAQPEEFETIRRDPTSWFWSEYRNLPGMMRRTAHSELEGRMLGVRAVENFFRRPYGPGWALTGDAAYVKDPCTGYGIGDALLQSFMIAKAIDEWLEGAEWEPVMEAYTQRRDASLRPLFEQTVAAMSARDEPRDTLDQLRAVLLNQHDARRLVQGLPRVLDELFDPLDRFRHAFLATAYADGRAQALPSIGQETGVPAR